MKVTDIITFALRFPHPSFWTFSQIAIRHTCTWYKMRERIFRKQVGPATCNLLIRQYYIDEKKFCYIYLFLSPRTTSSTSSSQRSLSLYIPSDFSSPLACVCVYALSILHINTRIHTHLFPRSFSFCSAIRWIPNWYRSDSTFNHGPFSQRRSWWC